MCMCVCVCCLKQDNESTAAEQRVRLLTDNLAAGVGHS